jgi:hypothetical protein
MIIHALLGIIFVIALAFAIFLLYLTFRKKKTLNYGIMPLTNNQPIGVGMSKPDTPGLFPKEPQFFGA